MNLQHTTQNEALIALPDGSSLVDSITIASVDGSTKSIAITIMGVNDAPVIGAGLGVNEGVVNT